MMLNNEPDIIQNNEYFLPLDLKLQGAKKSTEVQEKLKQPINKIRNFDTLLHYNSDKFLKNFFTNEKAVSSQCDIKKEKLQKSNLDSKHNSVIKAKKKRNYSQREINESLNKFETPSKIFAESALLMKNEIITKSLNENTLKQKLRKYVIKIQNTDNFMKLTDNNTKLNNHSMLVPQSISKPRINKDMIYDE